MDWRSTGEAGHDRLYQAIKARVVAHDFPEGKRIYLQPIADQLGTGTWPVRRALDRLAAEGLVLKARRKGFYALTLREDEVIGHYQLTRQVLSLGIETLEPESVRELSEYEPIAAVLAELDRQVPADGRKLATCTGDIFASIAALTGKSAITLAINRSNDHLYYIRTLECQRLEGVQSELVCFCELLLAGRREELVTALDDYHERRIALLPTLLEFLRE